VRIDSLFVDEGFGTLDPEALETAIAALETLRQDHKTVGIISHVGLLKERISTQIAVEKQPGGTARIRVVS
jgi:exonuclease SbcC